jgi:hypothetical protein
MLHDPSCPHVLEITLCSPGLADDLSWLLHALGAGLGLHSPPAPAQSWKALHQLLCTQVLERLVVSLSSSP